MEDFRIKKPILTGLTIERHVIVSQCPPYMRRLLVNYSDFWPGFDVEDNYFSRLLRRRFEVEVSPRPELLIYATFGHRFTRFSCSRIFYTGEARPPRFQECDFAFSFDHMPYEDRQYRLPLYALGAIESLEGDPPQDPHRILDQKKHFCAFLYSNHRCDQRNQLFRMLSSYRPVRAGGKLFNNVGGRVEDKLEFYRECKFVISFENVSYRGYTTEKLTDALLAESLPIYWGNDWVGRDFNTRRFINFHDFSSMEDLVQHVIDVDSDDSKYMDYLQQPCYPQGHAPQANHPDRILNAIEEVLARTQRPIGSRAGAKAREFITYQIGSTAKRLGRVVVSEVRRRLPRL